MIHVKNIPFYIRKKACKESERAKQEEECCCCSSPEDEARKERKEELDSGTERGSRSVFLDERFTHAIGLLLLLPPPLP